MAEVEGVDGSGNQGLVGVQFKARGSSVEAAILGGGMKAPTPDRNSRLFYRGTATLYVVTASSSDTVDASR